MNVLYAGSAGYIGSHTAVQLLNEGYEVVVVDNYSNSNPEVINRIEKITARKCFCIMPRLRTRKQLIWCLIKTRLIV